jgi:hypothetical protein
LDSAVMYIEKTVGVGLALPLSIGCDL